MPEKKTNPKYLTNQTNQENRELTIKLIKTSVILAAIAGFMYLWMLTIFSNIDTFWEFLSRGKENDQPFGQDTTPPPPPLVESLPKATKDIALKIIGYSESGATVKLFFNDKEKDTAIANNEGYFSFLDINLLPGENKFHVLAIDGSGNQSQPSITQTIIFDKDAPEVTISQPLASQVFSGDDNKVQVTGKTEFGAKITVNDHIALQDSQGSFSYTIALERSPGEKTINIQVTDIAGNVTDNQVKVIYQP